MAGIVLIVVVVDGGAKFGRVRFRACPEQLLLACHLNQLLWENKIRLIKFNVISFTTLYFR